MEFVWVEPLGMRVGKYEVTNGEYRRYKADHNSGKYWIDIYLNGRCGGSLDGDRQPVVMVSWEDAKGFCRWLTEKARREGKIGGGLEYRLPHDWEWSVAVGLDEPRGGTPQEKDGKIAGENWAVRNLVGISAYYDPKEKGNIIGVYPWGTEYPPPPGAGNYCGTEGLVHGRKIAARTGYRDGYSLSSPVGSFKANQYGLYDMGGNVWEWCEDYYNGVGGRRVLRGGSYDSFSPHEMLSSFRALCDPVNRIEIGGFRVVCAAAGPLRVPAGFRAAPGTTAEPYTKTGWAQEVVHEKTGIALVFIPAGVFMMGSSASELALVGIDGKSSQHLVQIAQPFYLGKYEVTQGEWTKVMGANPSHFKGDERLPVEKVSWYDCQEFLGKAGDGLRLPAEAEWEYACRAGTTTLFSSGNTAEDLGAVAWYGVNSGGKTHVVGGKPPNAWGLYDMHGNVAEWCQEEHGQGGWGRVSRGGWWPRHGGDLDLRFSRSAYSGRDNAAGRRPYQGFRVVAAPRP
jgi:formylglycine-generating enzyme required for sulfatase activity